MRTRHRPINQPKAMVARIIARVWARLTIGSLSAIITVGRRPGKGGRRWRVTRPDSPGWESAATHPASGHAAAVSSRRFKGSNGIRRPGARTLCRIAK